MRRPRLPRPAAAATTTALALAASALPLVSGTAASAAGSCPAVSVRLSAGAWSPLGTGVRLRTVTVATSGGSIPLHQLEVDTAAGARLQQLGTAATSSTDVRTAVGRSGALAGLNGDFFHVTTAGDAVAADGVVGATSGPVKGWAAGTPAFALRGGTPEVSDVHLAATVTVTESTGGSAHALLGAPAAAPPAAPAAPAPAAPVAAVSPRTGAGTTPAARRATTAQQRRAAALAKKRRAAALAKKRAAGLAAKKRAAALAKKRRAAALAKKRHRRTHGAVRRPVTPLPTTAAPATGPGAPGASAPLPPGVVQQTPTGRRVVLPVAALNDDQGSGSVLYTSSWGPSDRSAGVPSTARELDLQGGVVTAVRAGSGSGSPGVGQQALVLTGALAQAVSWVQPGDRVEVSAALVDASGAPVGLAVGGNRHLVAGGAVQDYQCTLDQETGRRPRVAVGVAGSRVSLLASDGDLRGVPGLTVREAAEVAQQLGLGDVLNLDGGNSTQLVVQQSGTPVQVSRNSQSPPRRVPDGFLVTAG